MEIDDFTPVEFPSNEEVNTLFDSFPDTLTDWDASWLLDLDNNPDLVTTSIKSAKVNAKAKDQTRWTFFHDHCTRCE